MVLFATHVIEEMVRPCRVFAREGRDALLKAVEHMSEELSPSMANYSCRGYIFSIRYYSNHFFVVVNHPVGKELGGDGSGVVKVYPFNNSLSPLLVYSWIWRRLKHSGGCANALRWFTLLEYVSRYITLNFHIRIELSEPK